MKYLPILICTFLSFQAVAQSKYTTVDAHAMSVDYTRDYRSAAQELTAPYTDDESKARALFTWIASNIKYDNKRLAKVQKSGKRGRTQIKAKTKEGLKDARLKQIDKFVADALKKKKGICQDFSWLYQAMCISVDMECEFVTGLSKTPQSNKRGSKYHNGNHAWNAVKINGQWTLMDVTWSAGMHANDDMGDGFFMVDPEVFVMTHYPTESKWQLLDEPYSKKEFNQLPLMHSGYLKFNVQDFSPMNGKLSKSDKSVALKVTMDLQKGHMLMLILNNKPTPVEYTSDNGVHTIPMAQYLKRGTCYVGVHDGEFIEPIISFKVR